MRAVFFDGALSPNGGTSFCSANIIPDVCPFAQRLGCVIICGHTLSVSVSLCGGSAIYFWLFQSPSMCVVACSCMCSYFLVHASGALRAYFMMESEVLLRGISFA